MQFGPIEQSRRQDIDSLRDISIYRISKFERKALHPIGIRPGDNEAHVALAIVIQEPEAEIGYVRELSGDRPLDLLLAMRSGVVPAVLFAHACCVS